MYNIERERERKRERKRERERERTAVLERIFKSNYLS